MLKEMLKKLSFFQTSKLISNCPPLYDEVGEMATPIAILLFWSGFTGYLSCLRLIPCMIKSKLNGKTFETV